MRGLVIRQPWAGLFAAGLKVNAAGEIIEFRNRKTHIRERVAVYAASTKRPCSFCEFFWECIPEYQTLGPMCQPRGVVVCIATLADCRAPLGPDLAVPGCPDVADPEFARTWAWVFTDLRTLPEPVACKPLRGAQVWFTVPPEVEREVLRQTARTGEGGNDE